MVRLSELFNRHVFKFSRLYGYSAIFLRQFFFVIVNSRVRTGEINAMRLLFNCESFFCPELLYFIKTLNSQNGHESIFYLHYCQFHHLIYLGTCRTFARTNHWNNLPLLWFESHLIESNYFACHSHQFKYCLFYELHVSTSIMKKSMVTSPIRKLEVVAPKFPSCVRCTCIFVLKCCKHIGFQLR